MSAWWSKVQGNTEKHDGPSPQMQGAIRIRFAVTMGGIPAEECGLFRRDPDKYPDEPDMLPGLVARANRAAARKRGNL